MEAKVLVINVREVNSPTTTRKKSENQVDNNNELTERNSMKFPEKIEDIEPYRQENECQSSKSNESAGKSSLADATYWNGLHVVSILIACILNASTLTLVPRKNSIKHPEYWYESIILVVFGHTLRRSFVMITELYFFTNTKQLITAKIFVVTFLCRSVLFIIVYGICCLIWNVYLSRHHPMPFIGMCVYANSFLQFCFAWFLFPVDRRAKQNFRIQVRCWIVYTIFFALLRYQLMAVSFIAGRVPAEFQWVLAFVLPAVKDLNSRILLYFVQKTPDINTKRLKFLASTQLMVLFANFVATRISSFNTFTVYSIFTIELALHVHGCYKIIQLTKRIKEEGTAENFETDAVATERSKVVIKLVMIEYLEAFVPIAYGICFAAAYYGPNAEILRNVKSDYFGGKVLNNVLEFYTPLCLMLAFDVLGMVVSAVSLRYFCNLNLFQVFCNLMKENWPIFMVLLSSIASNFGARDINLAFDFTMKFLWTTEEGRTILFGNYTE